MNWNLVPRSIAFGAVLLIFPNGCSFVKQINQTSEKSSYAVIVDGQVFRVASGEFTEALTLERIASAITVKKALNSAVVDINCVVESNSNAKGKLRIDHEMWSEYYIIPGSDIHFY